ncbi:Extradiol ring-cleavage dioxygenase, class III enzyme, subunit B [Meredithblackwellia eburnea MCA 4105]
MSTSATTSAQPSIIRSVREEWSKELEALPSLEETGGKIPSIFLAHGQPLLVYPSNLHRVGFDALQETQGANGTLANFLKDIGPVLVDKYKPKAIVVFSAHWETHGERLVTDYGEENPLLMDYFGFPDELYKLKFESRGDTIVAERVVELFKQAGMKARLSSKLEQRGEDGRGFAGPGLDHGVFVPFKLMFNDKAPVPIIQVSIDASLSPEKEWAIGAALEPLRSEGILIISGGLTIHTFRDFGAFAPSTAKPVYKGFEESIIDAVAVPDPTKRKQALVNLIHHPGFRACHPREEHFVPIYIAAGAADATGGKARVLSGIHGAKTVAFGLP